MEIWARGSTIQDGGIENPIYYLAFRSKITPALQAKVDVDTFHKGIQYALETLGNKSKFGFESTTVSNFKS